MRSLHFQTPPQWPLVNAAAHGVDKGCGLVGIGKYKWPRRGLVVSLARQLTLSVEGSLLKLHRLPIVPELSKTIVIMAENAELVETVKSLKAQVEKLTGISGLNDLAG